MCITASGTGDPHFTTFDGKIYHFQGEGDFTALEIIRPLEFVLQGRHKMYPEWKYQASWHIGIAFGRPDLAFQVILTLLRVYYLTTSNTCS